MTDIKTAAGTGDQLKLLEALREKLADTLQNSNSGRDIAALTRQILVVAEKIKAFETETQREDTVLEIIRARHAAGKPGAVRDENHQRATRFEEYEQ